MRPHELTTRIFLDGGDPRETREIIDLLGFVDGQTTNPTLVSKNPEAKERLERGERFSETELLDFYRGVVREIGSLIPQGSISIEVYADHATSADQMLEQGKEMFSWIPNAHIKFPTSQAGLLAAERAIAQSIRVNMTLCFTQEQAAAVYAATRGAEPGDVFVSPFVGRLDDRGENGMDLIANILKMYRAGDDHVAVLTASVRNMDHFLRAVQLGSPIISAPHKVLKEWGEGGLPMPGNDFTYRPEGLDSIGYRDLDLSKGWEQFDIAHELTDKGMASFSEDWNRLIH